MYHEHDQKRRINKVFVLRAFFYFYEKKYVIEKTLCNNIMGLLKTNHIYTFTELRETTDILIEKA